MLHKKEGNLFYGGSRDSKRHKHLREQQAERQSHEFLSNQSQNMKDPTAFKATIIWVYAPIEEKGEEEKVEFYADLEEAYDNSSSFDMKIILGDFNSEIGKKSIFFPTIGLHSLHNTSSNNEVMLINVVLTKRMIISSIWFSHKRIHKGMWRSPDGHIVNQLITSW